MEFAPEPDLARPGDGKDHKQQPVVRAGAMLFAALYLALFGFFDHPLYLLFILYALTTLLCAAVTPPRDLSATTVISILVADNAFSLLGLHVAKDAGYFLLLFLPPLACGFGARFGIRYLWLSACIAVSGVGLLWLFDPFWNARSHACIAFSMGVPFLSLYFLHFRRGGVSPEIHRQPREAAGERTLLAFAHDVRAQLQTLKSTIEIVALDTSRLPVQAARDLETLDRITDSMARLTTNVLQRTLGGRTSGDDQPLSPTTQCVRIGYWLADLLERYAPVCKQMRCKLTVLFAPMPTDQLQIATEPLERALINVMSNATRFCSSGRITIRTGLATNAASRTCLRLVVENSITGSGDASGSVASGSGATYHGAGVGLEIVASQLRQSGGKASFRKSRKGNFLSEIIVPCECMAASSDYESIEAITLVDFGGRDYPDWSHSAAIAGTRLVRLEAKAYIDGVCPDACRPGTRLTILNGDAAAIGPVLAAGANAIDNLIFVSEEAAAPSTQIPSVALDGARSPGVLGHWKTAFDFAARSRPTTLLEGLDSREAIDLRQVTVLLVDDSETYLEHQAMMLQSAGATVLKASTCREAVSSLDTHAVDVVVADFLLENETIAHLVREWELRFSGRRKPKVIVLTGASVREVRAELGSSFVDAVMTKPVCFRRLCEEMRPSPIDAKKKAPAVPASIKDGRLAFPLTVVDELLGIGKDPALVVGLLECLERELSEARAGLLQQSFQPAPSTARKWVHATLGLADAGGVAELATGAANLLEDIDRLSDADRRRSILHLARETEKVIEAARVCMDRLRASLHATQP